MRESPYFLVTDALVVTQSHTKNSICYMQCMKLGIMYNSYAFYAIPKKYAKFEKLVYSKNLGYFVGYVFVFHVFESYFTRILPLRLSLTVSTWTRSRSLHMFSVIWSGEKKNRMWSFRRNYRMVAACRIIAQTYCCTKELCFLSSKLYHFSFWSDGG